jgi:hypothetical protein
MRHVILHYHFFKNAGTSVDAILSANFGKAWLTGEFDSMNNHEEVAEWISAHPETEAFSSHTAQFPLPRADGVTVYPIVFLRHPLDRMLSAYSFERTQQSDSVGARLAKKTDFAGYLRARLDMPHDRQCRNFHTYRLARFIPGPRISEMDRALEALVTLPFIGLVEDFAGSAKRLEAWLKPHFPGFAAFSARKNVSASQETTLEERLALMRRDIGEPLYAELVDANLKDLCLHHAAVMRLSAPA